MTLIQRDGAIDPPAIDIARVILLAGSERSGDPHNGAYRYVRALEHDNPDSAEPLRKKGEGFQDLCEVLRAVILRMLLPRGISSGCPCSQLAAGCRNDQ